MTPSTSAPPGCSVYFLADPSRQILLVGLVAQLQRKTKCQDSRSNMVRRPEDSSLKSTRRDHAAPCTRAIMGDPPPLLPPTEMHRKGSLCPYKSAILPICQCVLVVNSRHHLRNSSPWPQRKRCIVISVSLLLPPCHLPIRRECEGAHIFCLRAWSANAGLAAMKRAARPAAATWATLFVWGFCSCIFSPFQHMQGLA